MLTPKVVKYHKNIFDIKNQLNYTYQTSTLGTRERNKHQTDSHQMYLLTNIISVDWHVISL